MKLPALLPRFSPAAVLTAARTIALFGIVFSAKLIYIGIGGSDLPNWDQWDAEARNLLQPWFEGRFHWIDLFQSHNEHRVALTKLLCLFQVSLNGQWDARFQCVCNAAMHAGLVAVSWLWLRKLLAAAWASVAFFLVLVALTATPMSFQNLLGGFHSQQVFLLGLSLAAFALVLDAPAWTRRWWGGVACAALALFSMGSGFFAAAVVFGAAAVDALRFRAWRERFPTLVATALLVVAGWFLHVNFTPHEPLKAHTAHDFVLTFWRACQWPTRDIALFAVVAWVPWSWLLIRVWRAGRAASPQERVVAATGAWVLLQYVAAAYARGAGGEWPADRYFDTEAVGLLANAAALIIFFAAPGSRAVRVIGCVVAALWTGLLTHGLREHLPHTFSDLGVVAREMRRNEIVTRAYLASNDRALLAREPVLPYPSAAGFAERIDPPVIRALMPVSVRVPLPLAAATRGGSFLCYDFSLHPQPLLGAPKPPEVRDGLSPATPRLEYAIIWGSFGSKSGADWESEPLTPTQGGWLKFELAGDTDVPGVSLQLLDARTRRPITDIRPTKAPHDTWRAAYVPTPERAYVVVAHVADPAHWLAFNQPTEMTTISHAVWEIMKNGAVILWISCGAAVVLGVASLGRFSRRGRI